MPELEAFAKVTTLQPSEARELMLAIPRRDLAIYNDQQRGWEIEPGPYQVRVGGSWRDLRLTGGIMGTD